MFDFFTDNKPISCNQSGFKPKESSMNQDLSITHNIYYSFDDGRSGQIPFTEGKTRSCL